MPKKKVAKKKTASPSFEQSITELEQIVAELEGGQLGLDDALKCYERGVERLQQCQDQLSAAERKIELLSGVDAEGNPITQPFEEAKESTLETKAARRSQRRSSVDDRDRLF